MAEEGRLQKFATLLRNGRNALVAAVARSQNFTSPWLKASTLEKAG